MKIGLLFGSFNPIHNGHLIIAEHIINFYTDKILFVVSPLNPFKQNHTLLEAKYRISLVQKAIEGNNQFDLCDIEFHLPVPSYTIDTLQVLKKQYLNDDLSIIVGSDNFLTIEQWKSSNELLSNYNFIVFERPGFRVPQKKQSANIIFTQSPLINISSTEIRNLIKAKKSIRYLVPDKAIKEIEKNNFYTKRS